MTEPESTADADLETKLQRLEEEHERAVCYLCEEPVTKSDKLRRALDMRGKDMIASDWHDRIHIECEVRSIVGSVGHQQEKCSCFGGTEEDPPDMTQREGAWAAYELFHRETSKRYAKEWQAQKEKWDHGS